ncbi:hypothetical protein EYZ11_001338 [Aspergillus tanneri]|uniref:Uncharacterized protein n=1 Tax=Aspergillus tanneri TaxID=1220188 RepID=A0A4S3JUV4_9EURO|nr:hypothetical protein EYZ11_001338 [Aspergillus tanneri]
MYVIPPGPGRLRTLLRNGRITSGHGVYRKLGKRLKVIGMNMIKVWTADGA